MSDPILEKDRQAIFVKDYEVNSFLVNPQRKLGLYAVLNLLQDVAWLHAAELGQLSPSLHQEALETIWVVARQRLQMWNWPLWGSALRVETWVRRTEGLAICREFIVYSSDPGPKSLRKIGQCSSSWVLMNSKTRKALRGVSDRVQPNHLLERSLDLELHRIEIPQDFKDLAHFEVRNSDLDMQDHVNNTRYAQWILDAVPFSWHRSRSLSEYEINFLAEAQSGDVITIRKAPSLIADPETKSTKFYGWRERDQKIVFAASLNTTQA